MKVEAKSEARSNQTAAQLADRLSQRTALIGVIGLGYVGLPLINAFFEAGYATLGFDLDARKIAQLLRGESYIRHIPSPWIQKWIDEKRFSATEKMDRLGEPDAVLICVPTPLSDSRDPDLSYVESTAHAIARSLRVGQLIVLESTTYPGTTRDVVVPILETSGLKCGRDFFVAYSPEREDPGNQQFSASRIPKVVGGMDPQSLELALALYRPAVAATVPVSSCEVAEACKILENTYRSVNIAMVNELKMLFQHLGIDIWEVIHAARTKPFGFQAFYPGPGLGGHCIPIDPFYLSWLARKHEHATRFIELAGEINTSMPSYVVQRLTEALNDHGKPIKGSRICILGAAYKKDVDDPRESPAFKLMELLAPRGAILTYNDPYVKKLPKMRSFDVPAMESQELTREFISRQDCMLLVTDHSCYDYAELVRHAKLFVDTRNATAGIREGREKIVRA